MSNVFDYEACQSWLLAVKFEFKSKDFIHSPIIHINSFHNKLIVISTRKEVKFELSEQLSQVGCVDGVPLPREHKMLMSDVSQSLAVFSETAGGDPMFAFEGKVVKRADCRPVENPNYLLLKKNAIKKAGQPARKVQQITEKVHGTSFKPIADHKVNIERDRKRKEEGKRARSEKKEVMDKLFSAFERHQYYTLKDLVHLTQQPVGYLKSILKEICNYNLKNPHKNTWELKQEYRHYKEEPGNED
eukprot:gene16651-8089_t